ncbi:unnamed protein product [Urochloa decumbens]|uniref:GPN-loop GTPase 2 n=1 Tax=Urochloa decumbens TaxID=240449 RepID=A0ABC9GZD4_9POAL
MVFGQVVTGPPGSGKTTYCNGMSQFLSLLGRACYCMDYLGKNIDWLEEKSKPLIEGEVELFFLHSNARSVINKLIKKLILRLTAVHLIDAHLCCESGKYVSALLLSLSTMLHLELPHINVLSKIDLIENYGNLGIILPLSNLLQLLLLVEFDDKESVGNLVKLIDKSNGYIFSSIDSSAVELSKIAAAPLDWDYYRYPFLVIIFSDKFLSPPVYMLSSVV